MTAPMPETMSPREKVARTEKRKLAYTQVKLAVARGDLSVPSACEFCKRDPGRGRDGRRLLQGDHHKGYDLPLVVRWLCPPCHRAVTPLNPHKGADKPEAKLTDKLVEWIRTVPISNRKLGAMLGVDYSTIQHARSGKTWKHVPMPKREK